tara:strand:+ start:925 stop:1227 length:303 start_codon:yes stop_codon:yes gene_type:complete
MKVETKPIISDNNGRDEVGRFTNVNTGKPKGAVNKSTKDIKDFIVTFLNDKAFEIPMIWDSLDDKDKATLYLHFCRMVIPKAGTEQKKNKKNHVFLMCLQ